MYALIKFGQDPDDIGMVQWRPAFYCCGDLNNFMLFLDKLFLHLSTAMAKEKNFDVHITPHINVNIDDCWDDLICA